jgi:hypothetical protein
MVLGEVRTVGARCTLQNWPAMDIRHRMIVFDAADIDAESAFWAAFLGGTVEEWSERWRSIFVDGDWALGVQSAPNHVPPDWPDGAPQQMHLDFYFEGRGPSTLPMSR